MADKPRYRPASSRRSKSHLAARRKRRHGKVLLSKGGPRKSFSKSGPAKPSPGKSGKSKGGPVHGGGGSKSKSTKSKGGPRKSQSKGGPRKAYKERYQPPIELYYWPTPNGWKVSIMLEECKLPYVLKPVNIGKGEQFAPAFLKISPNNRMPAIVDPHGPGGRKISVFESGAILQYLGRKTDQFYPTDERERVKVDEWLFWQVGGLGPMAGQANHFLNYAKEGNDYARERYVNEVHRLLGVMENQLKTKKFLAGKYSIADMACWGWVVGVSRMQDMNEFPNVKAWRDRIGKRPAVDRGFKLGRELREAQNNDPKAQEEARRILFGQRARL